MRIKRYTTGVTSIHKSLGLITKGILSAPLKSFIRLPGVVYVLQQEPFEYVANLLGGKRIDFNYQFGIIIGSKYSKMSKVFSNIYGEKFDNFENLIELVAEKHNSFKVLNSIVASKQIEFKNQYNILGDKSEIDVELLKMLMIAGKFSDKCIIDKVVVKESGNKSDLIPILCVLDLI